MAQSVFETNYLKEGIMQSSATNSTSVIAAAYLRELEAEARATRECIENVPLERADWKPHEKSMELGYLALLVAEIPRWIQKMIEHGVIDLSSYERYQAANAEDLVQRFDENMEGASKALRSLDDAKLKTTFELKNKDQVLMSTPLGESISSTINHLVHHRGQLSVYLRLTGRDVPSIYGPSADSPGF
jgi:uncharacterized damage-inducible protein DinB